MPKRKHADRNAVRKMFVSRWHTSRGLSNDNLWHPERNRGSVRSRNPYEESFVRNMDLRNRRPQRNNCHE